MWKSGFSNKNSTERNYSVFRFSTFITFADWASPIQLNQCNIYKNPGCQVVNKNIIIFKDLGASFMQKLLCSTKSCLEATEYSHKWKITNDPSLNVDLPGKCTTGTSMLQKSSGNLILTKPFLYANRRFCRKTH